MTHLTRRIIPEADGTKDLEGKQDLSKQTLLKEIELKEAPMEIDTPQSLERKSADSSSFKEQSEKGAVCRDKRITGTLDRDCWRNVFKFLSTQQIVAYFAPVCRDFRDLALEESAEVLIYRSANPELSHWPISREGQNRFKHIYAAHRFASSMHWYIKRRAATLKVLVVRLNAEGNTAKSVLDAAFACKQLKVLEIYDNCFMGSISLVLKTFPSTLEVFKVNFKVELQFEYGEKPFKLQVFGNSFFFLENLPQSGAVFDFLTNLKVMDMHQFVDKFDSRIHVFQSLQVLNVQPPNWWKTNEEFWKNFLLLPNLQRLSLHRLMVVEGDPLELSQHPKLEFLLIDCDLEDWEDIALILQIPQLTIFSVDPVAMRMLDGPLEYPLYFPEDKMENSSLQHLFLSQLPEAEIELPYLFSAPNLKSVHITTIEQYTVNGEAEPKIESQNLQVKFFGGYKKVNEETRGILTEYGFTSPLSETASESVDEDESEFEGEDFSSNVWTLRKGGPQIPEELEDLHEIECHVFQSQIRADDIADIKQYVNWKNSERACKEYVDFIGDRNKH